MQATDKDEYAGISHAQTQGAEHAGFPEREPLIPH
jgi:hypothetical protein